MAGNDNASTKQTTPTKTPKVVGGKVVLETKTLDANQPILKEQAGKLFAAQVAEQYGEGVKLSNVAVTVGKHHVGKSVTYDVTAEAAS